MKEKGYSQRERRVTELEFNKRMEIETQMASDRERAAAQKAYEEERNDPSRRKREVEVGVGSAVRRPVVKRAGKVSGLSTFSSSSARPGVGAGGGSVVKKPTIPRRPGRTF